MEILFTIISLVALCIYSVFFARILNIPTACSPLITLSFTTIYLVVFGVFGLLLLGGYVYFLCALIIGALFALKKVSLPKISIWFYAFAVISALMIIFFGIRQPLLNSWDEFSFWGTAVKMTKLNNELHTTAEIGWKWVASQKPGLMVIGYFFQFFGSYQQWKIFVGLNIIALSVFAAALTPFKAKTKVLGVPLALILFFTPYVFTIYRQVAEPSNVYMNAHSDVPMAWLFCATIILYYVLKKEKAPIWPVNIVVMALTMTRDTALPFALIAWVIISVDILFLNKDVTFLKLKQLKAKIMHVLCMLFSILICFFGWAFYISLILGADPFGDIGGSETLSMTSMLIMGITQLFGVNTTENFAQTMTSMFNAYFTLPMSMFGTGVYITIIIMGILFVAAISSNSKKHMLTCVKFAVLSFMGFVAYYVFIGFTFAFIFVGDTAEYLIGYERYIYPYYIAWFSVSVFLLCISALAPRKKLLFLPQGSIYLILLLFIYRYNLYVPQGMSFIDYHDGYLYERKQLVNNAQDIIETLGVQEQGNIYFISQGDNGNRWFQYSGDLLPLQLEYSFGGGTLSLPENATNKTYEYTLSIEEFMQYLQENECEFIFVERSDDALVRDFGYLFSDELQLSKSEKPVLYKVNGTENELTFDLIGEVGQ